MISMCQRDRRYIKVLGGKMAEAKQQLERPRALSVAEVFHYKPGTMGAVRPDFTG